MVKTAKASTEVAPAPTGMVAVMRYFDMQAAEFRAEWNKLSPADKAELKAAVEALNG